MDNKPTTGVDITMQAIQESGRVLSPEKQAVLDSERANLEIAQLRKQISELNLEAAENELYAEIVSGLRFQLNNQNIPLDDICENFVFPRLLAPATPEKEQPEEPEPIDITDQQEAPEGTEQIQPESPITQPENPASNTGSSGGKPLN